MKHTAIIVPLNPARLLVYSDITAFDHAHRFLRSIPSYKVVFAILFYLFLTKTSAVRGTLVLGRKSEQVVAYSQGLKVGWAPGVAPEA